MSMKQLIYASRPFGYDPSILAGILATARAKNAQNDITGALICRPDIYLQLLEGPPAKVDTLFENICKDDRHVEVTVLVQGKVDDRLFPDWAMKHDPADTWLWTPEEIKRGALKHATAREVRAVFVRSDRKPPSQRL
jgi:hypothetical protein